MTTTEIDVPVRLVHVGNHVWRVQRADTGKVLGMVDGHGGVWRASASMRAFLGDGENGADTLSDHVPLVLYWPLHASGDRHIPGMYRSQSAAVAALQTYLDQQRAPVMGHPAHPLVQHREGSE